MNTGPCSDCGRRTIALSGRTPGLHHRLLMTGLQLGYLKGNDELVCRTCLSLWLPANLTVYRSDQP
jgi:hypothetical protein